MSNQRRAYLAEESKVETPVPKLKSLKNSPMRGKTNDNKNSTIIDKVEQEMMEQERFSNHLSSSMRDGGRVRKPMSNYINAYMDTEIKNTRHNTVKSRPPVLPSPMKIKK